MNKRAMQRKARPAGFTLVELMVTVVIATTLLAIAIPSYNSQIRRSRRTEARNALLDLAAREESLFATTGAYTSVPTSVGYTGASFPITVGSSYYSVNVCVPGNATGCTGPATTPSFQLVATPVSGTTQAADSSCQKFMVDSTGFQSSVDGSSADTTATCWK
jgi:type IV pilus assembly protein PilE